MAKQTKYHIRDNDKKLLVKIKGKFCKTVVRPATVYESEGQVKGSKNGSRRNDNVDVDVDY